MKFVNLKNPTQIAGIGLAMVIAMFFVACGGGGGGGADSSSTPSVTTATISGGVVKGPVTGATVTFYVLNADGSKGAQLGTTTTDTSGNYTVILSPAPTTPILAESSGGTYVDEATAATVTLAATDKLQAVLPVGTTRATVTPLTHIAAARAQALAAGGTPLATAVASSNMGVATQYAIADIVATLPPAANDANSVATASRDERIYALVLAGIAQQASSVGVRAIDLAAALAEDAKDGILDGQNGAVAISVPTIAGGSLPLPITAGTTDLQAAINAFIASVNNQTNITQVSIPLTPVNLGVNTVGALYTSLPVLPAAVSGQAYTATLTATGGTPPYTCALTSGSLPSGYSLVPSTCQITGTAGTVAGDTFSTPFVITLTDSAIPANTVDFAPLYLTTTLAAPVVAFSAQPKISEGTGGSFTVTATGGATPYYFKLDSFLNGTPPLGTSVDLFTGTVTIPATAKAGIYSFGVCAVDIGGRSSCTTTTITVTVNGAAASVQTYTGTFTGIGSRTIVDTYLNCSYSVLVSGTVEVYSVSGASNPAADGYYFAVLGNIAETVVTASSTNRSWSCGNVGEVFTQPWSNTLSRATATGANISGTLNTVQGNQWAIDFSGILNGSSITGSMSAAINSGGSSGTVTAIPVTLTKQ